MKKVTNPLPEERGTGFPAPTGDKTRLRLQSNDLFTRNREVIIEHDGEEYRLRLTSKGKLILTK